MKIESSAYTLAIPSLPQEFKHLRGGAVYWVAIEAPEYAIKLAGQTLASVGKADKAVLLAPRSEELDEVLGYLVRPDRGPSDLQSYKLKTYSLKGLLQLPKQMDRALKPTQRLIVLMLPINEIEMVLWQTHASILLKTWRNWAESNACVLLVVSYGTSAQALAHDLYAQSNYLSGLALMYSAQHTAHSELRYDIQHWRSALGAMSSKRFQLRATEAFFELVIDPKSPAQAADQFAVARKNTLIFERVVLEGTPITLVDGWQVVDSWQALIEKGSQEVSPILIFALNASEDVEDLARILYRLRQQRADSIKIVVREMQQALRKQEVDLLNHCGASLVVPAGTKLAHFFNLLENVKKQPSVYQLTTNLEQAIAVVKPQQQRGVVTPIAFCEYVERLLVQIPITGFAGVLVALRPVPMLSAEQVLTQAQFTRMGDVACTANNVVYVFLFGCRPSFALLALQRIFKLPFSELVIENQIYDEQASVEEQVLRIRKSQNTSLQIVNTNQSSAKNERPAVEAKKAMRTRPVFQPLLKPLNS